MAVNVCEERKFSAWSIPELDEMDHPSPPPSDVPLNSSDSQLNRSVSHKRKE